MSNLQEWRGKILRKKLESDGTVIHEMGVSGNWNAAVEIRAQSGISRSEDEEIFGLQCQLFHT